jgi:hypothetical protein
VAGGAEPLGVDIAAGLRHIGATLSRKPSGARAKRRD